MTTVAVLGTGIMGAPMAARMLAAGLDVRVWNRTREKAEPLAGDGAVVAATPAEAVDGADLLATILTDGDAVAQVVAQAADGLHGDQVWMQMSTVGLATDALRDRARDLGIAFVDAPVLGTRQPAEQGTLTVLAAPGDVARSRLRPLFDAVGERTVWLGEPGEASRLKLAVNTWIIGLTTVLGESIALSESLGVDPERFLDAIEGGPVGAPYARIKGAAMIDRSYPLAFAAEGALKDLGLILEAARSTGVSARAALAAWNAFAAAITAGRGGDDMAAVVEAARPQGG